MTAPRRVVAALAVVLLATSCLDDPKTSATTPQEVVSQPAAGPAPTSAPPIAPVHAPVQAKPKPRPLLFAVGGDGDSWKDRQGREYRLGLVNAPEYNECYGSAATAKRRQLVADGFRASVYTTDTYGRSVAVVTTAGGVNVNVYLARHGFANDKYLAEFRHENPGLATQLDVAFAAAKRERLGLWSACAAPARQPATQAAQPSRSGCDAAYPSVCIPPPPPDLDCGDISYRRFTVLAPDPHHFDADHDGIGCESG
jgi:micrococcal nuclease